MFISIFRNVNLENGLHLLEGGVKMEFAFGVLTYNQEEFILETLESIKYQIETYGENNEFHIVVSDDASKDSTTSLVNMWLKKNSILFNSFELLVAEKNMGIVKNYNTTIEILKEKSQYYKVIGGDDLFSKNNLFDYIEDLKDNDIVSFFPLYLIGDKISYDEKRLRRFIHIKNKNTYKSNLVEMMKGGFFHTPSTFYNSYLYTEPVKEFVNKFRLFDDDPMWYMFLKQNTDIKIKFNVKPLIIYRIHENSVSNNRIKSTEISRKFLKELIKLRKYYYQDSDNIYMKIYQLISINSMKIGSPYLRPINYIREAESLFKKIFFKSKKELNASSNIIKVEVDLNQQYYKDIKSLL